jgi:hypothetical protein
MAKPKGVFKILVVGFVHGLGRNALITLSLNEREQGLFKDTNVYSQGQIKFAKRPLFRPSDDRRPPA